MKNHRQPSIDIGLGCVLRPWQQEDAAELTLAVRDPLVRHYSGTLIDTREQALAAIQRWSQRWTEQSGATWALRSDAAGGELLGSISFFLRMESTGCGMVGYWLLPAGRGRGLASAAVVRGTAEVFARFAGWFRIELSHEVENERSCAVARRAGFPAEGVMRGAMVYPLDGRRSDEHLHARLRTDPPD